MRSGDKIAIWLPLLTLFAMVIVGCQESVDPVLETEEAFSMYGYLDPSSDQQALRIFTVDGILFPTTTDFLDAVVTSVNMDTGETIVWRDSVITFRDRSIGHVFVADFRATHSTRYIITAVRSDGRDAFVDLITPPDGDVRIDNIVSSRSNVIVTMNWADVPRIIQADVSYFVRIPFPDGSDTTTVRVDIKSGRVQENSDGTWAVTIIPSSDIGAIFSALQIQPGRTPVILHQIEVKAFVVSEEWESPVGSFDPELLVQPGTFSNVHNGFGFVGGGYFDSFIFVLDDEIARDAGFSIDR